MHRPLTQRSTLLAQTLIFVFLAQNSAYADNLRGKALYENHCMACHDQHVHQREERKVSSRGELKGWVASWSAHQKLAWSVDEVEDVTHYLSDWLYGFSQ